MNGAESERLYRIDDVVGGIGNDTLIGSGKPNRLDGGPETTALLPWSPGTGLMEAPAATPAWVGSPWRTLAGIPGSAPGSPSS